ncbi:sprouty-related, EVH1 domain-containing protein 1 isoform X2 [Lepeophtheirus salmonis]|uniref:sprouty-related, EVH1 domain-containing protein 1 isoform X2 n=1 Tax=Lepeophtheirus salmonis TaxID=72036 RepID=UPI001AE6B586|nr:sprouty-related, EVH1 domain-containing protein 2-like isoform X2 [Lepeophtheirus salmonis]
MALDSNSVVRVRAQVMMRDDSTGGWVPMGGGGLSNVSVRKRKITHEDDQPCKHEYLIYGKRNSDQTVVLSCTIKRDFEYNKVMPTFHHWKTGNKKFGLTFQTAADARAFDKGVRLAIEDLLDAKSLACPHKHYRESKAKGMSESSPLHQYNLDIGDDDVFMQLHLPVEKSESGSNGLMPPSSSNSTPPPVIGGTGDGGSGCTSPVPPNSSSSHRLFIPPPPRLGLILNNSSTRPNNYKDESTETFIQHHHHHHHIIQDQQKQHQPPVLLQNKDYSYVKFPYREISQQEYSVKNSGDLSRKDSISSLKKHNNFLISSSLDNTSTNTQPGCGILGSGGDPFKKKKKNNNNPPSSSSSCSPSGYSTTSSSSSAAALSSSSKKKKLLVESSSPHPHLTCDRCRTSFSLESNPRGSCPEAPDCVKKTIEAVTCLQCAKCLLYHCMSDSEGDVLHPCDCSNVDGHWARRWISLTLLSVLVPCLCCYIPLMGCYKCARKCRICGGRHQPPAS